jgi:uncharacterized membrane protein
MSGRRVFITVLVSLLVIAILVTAGVMLYRMGFARGLAASGGLPAAGQFMHPYGYGMPGFDGGCPRAWQHGGGMFYGGHRPFGMFGSGGWIVCLLVLVGVVALVVAAFNALTRRRPAEVQAVVAPPAPSAPAPAPAPAKPARAAGRARTTKR